MPVTHPLRAAAALLPLVATALAAAAPHTAYVRAARASATDDIETVTERRFATIVGATTGASSISEWCVHICSDDCKARTYRFLHACRLSTLQANGTWPDVDYTAGCDAPTANWKAQTHWSRIRASPNHVVTLSRAGGLTLRLLARFQRPSQPLGTVVYQTQSNGCRVTMSAALSRWPWASGSPTTSLTRRALTRVETTRVPAAPPAFGIRTGSITYAYVLSVIGSGADLSTHRLPSWQVIGVPTFVGEVCLLLGDSLADTELGNCTKMTSRSFATFVTGINGVSAITGANALDIASIGIDEGLLTQNATLIAAGFDRVHADAVVQNATKADGIRADGSFGQHTGIIYNGNYGKD